jgi:hypothetical protein
VCVSVWADGVLGSFNYINVYEARVRAFRTDSQECVSGRVGGWVGESACGCVREWACGCAGECACGCVCECGVICFLAPITCCESHAHLIEGARCSIMIASQVSFL